MNSTSQFDKFMGRKVNVQETPHKYTVAGKEYDTPLTAISADETVVNEIEELLGGGWLRVWLPGTMGTMDYRLDRLNVHISKMNDGSYQITRINWG